MNTVTTASSTFLPPLQPSIQKEFQRNSLQFSTIPSYSSMVSMEQFLQFFTLHSGDIDCPIAPFLSIPSARLQSLILKKHLTTLNAQLKTNQKADPHLTRMILLNMFQIFQITRINFDQYLQIHKHPDTYSTQRDATTQTEHTTIKPKHLLRNPSNRMRSEMEKQNLDSYWPSDNNNDTDEECQKDPPETFLDDNSPYKTYTYVSF